MSSSHPARPAALLLDAGGTLVLPDYQRMAELLAELQLAVDGALLAARHAEADRHYAELLAAGGSHEGGWQALMRCWMQLAGVPASAQSAAVAHLRAEHDAFNLWRRVPAGLPAALDRVRAAGVALAVVSNSEGQLLRLLERVGLAERFDAVIDSALEGVRKPDPEIFLRACRRLGVAPAQCLYAGDLPAVDLTGAQRAGMAAALIDPRNAWPQHDTTPRYRSVVALIDALLGAQ